MVAILYAAIIAASICIDRIVKAWAQSALKPPDGGSIDLIEGVFRFSYVENRGAAFGILQNQRYIFIVLTIAVTLYLLYKLFLSSKKLPMFANISLSLIIGGAVGNLFDRIVYGYVVDMFDFHLINFAVFNVADSCVVVGVILLCIWVLFLEGKDKKQGDAKKAMVEGPQGGQDCQNS